MSLANQFKTVVLLGLLSGLLLGVGYMLGGYTGLVIGLVFALVFNFGSYWFSDKIVLKMYKAKPASKEDYPQIHSAVFDICQQMNLPMPKLYIVESANPNAFATGRSPKHAAVACTTGILNLLSKSELRAVLAHEMSHVKNRDMLVTTVAATIAAVISYVATMAQWAAIFGGFGGRDNDNNNIATLLVLAILTPIIAAILQLAISRSREYLADETGARTIKDPHSLASALQKLETGIAHNPMRNANSTTSSLFFANPFRMGGFTSLFSTHPPIKERVKRLHELKL